MKKIFFMGFFLCLTHLAAAEDKPFVYNDHGKRDPFLNLVTSGGSIVSYDTDYAITDLRLEGIMLSKEGEKLAIINGQILKEKQAIGQFVIDQIQNNVVVLTKGKEKFELKIKKEE